MRKVLAVVILTIVLQGCSLLSAISPVNIPDPFEQETGINTDVQLGKTNSLIKDKSLLKNVDSSSNVTNNRFTADKVDQISNYKDAPWLIIAFALAVGCAIPRLGDRKRIKRLREENNDFRETLRDLTESTVEGLREGRIKEVQSTPSQAT
jgi:hypothetical protein